MSPCIAGAEWAIPEVLPHCITQPCSLIEDGHSCLLCSCMFLRHSHGMHAGFSGSMEDKC